VRPGSGWRILLAGRPSTQLRFDHALLPAGGNATDLAQRLPDFAVAAMREALPEYSGGTMPGYDHPDVVLTGVETAQLIAGARRPRRRSPEAFTTGGGGSLPAKAQVMRAAFSRQPWTAFAWPKRLRSTCSAKSPSRLDAGRIAHVSAQQRSAERAERREIEPAKLRDC
jgi:hypothetical protein